MYRTPEGSSSQIDKSSQLVESIRRRQERRNYTANRRAVQRSLGEQFDDIQVIPAAGDGGGGGGGAEASPARSQPVLNLSPGISKIFKDIDETLGVTDSPPNPNDLLLLQLRREVELEKFQEKWDAWYNGDETAIGLKLFDADSVRELRTTLRDKLEELKEKYSDIKRPFRTIFADFEGIKRYASEFTVKAQEDHQRRIANRQNEQLPAPVQVRSHAQLPTRELISAVSTDPNKENILFEQVNAAVTHDSEYLGAEDLYLILEEQIEANPANYRDRDVHLTMVRNYLVNKIGKIGEQIAQTQGPGKQTEIRALMASRKVLVDKFERFSNLLTRTGAAPSAAGGAGADTSAVPGQLRIGGIYVEFC